MKDRSRDKDAVNESPSSTCDSDLIHASRKHQQDSWGLRLLRMYKAKRCICRTGVLGTPRVLRKGGNSDKDARSEFPPAACD